MNKTLLNPSDIQDAEKKKLKANRIKVKEIHHHSIRELRSLLGVTEIRAMELSAMSEFQSIPSVGRKFAEDLVQLGFYSLKELKGKNPAKLLDRFERQLGVWIDPCVEDQFRLVVHYADHPGTASHPGTIRNWWDFTTERKTYRQEKGYPANRPQKPWFDLEQYKTVNRIQASSQQTKTDLHGKLRSAIKYMKENLDEEVTLKKLAEIAHLSPFHFLRLFKTTYESTPIQFLTRLRMKKAGQLLKRSNRPVGWIGDSCGFKSQSSFIRLFKKEFGMTPMVFRSRRVNSPQPTEYSLPDR